MSRFSTKQRLGIDGTEAWVVSTDHITKVLDLVFKNRYGEIWLFNNDFLFFKNKDLFKNVYLHKIVRELGSRVSKVKVLLDEDAEKEVLKNQNNLMNSRLRDLSDFIEKNKLKTFPTFLFGLMSDVKKDSAFNSFFSKTGIPSKHTWIFYLHGESLSWEKQYGIVMFRPTEFPFADRDNPLGLSWHLSDRLILSSKQRRLFDSCFMNEDFFKMHWNIDGATKPIESQGLQSEGLAFGEPVDILVLTPADDEMSYLRKIFRSQLHEVSTPGTTNCYSLVTLKGRSVILARVGEGNVAASIATSCLLDLFLPKHVILLGVAGGVPERGRHYWAIGDVAIAQIAIDYEWGKIVEEKESPWKFIPKGDIDTTWGGERYDRFLYTKACKKANDHWQLSLDDIKSQIPLAVKPEERPLVIKHIDQFVKRSSMAHTGIVGSGSKIIASRKYVTQVVDKKDKDINILETEAAGVSSVCANRNVDYLVVRGIMDLANGETRADSIRKSLRHIAKITCGRFVAELLDEL